MFIAKNIKKYMDKRCLKQYELAKLVEVSQSTISDTLHGTKIPKVKILEKIAKVLGCTMEDLFKEDY